MASARSEGQIVSGTTTVTQRGVRQVEVEVGKDEVEVEKDVERKARLFLF